MAEYFKPTGSADVSETLLMGMWVKGLLQNANVMLFCFSLSYIFGMQAQIICGFLYIGALIIEVGKKLEKREAEKGVIV